MTDERWTEDVCLSVSTPKEYPDEVGMTYRMFVFDLDLLQDMDVWASDSTVLLEWNALPLVDPVLLGHAALQALDTGQWPTTTVAGRIRGVTYPSIPSLDA